MVVPPEGPRGAPPAAASTLTREELRAAAKGAEKLVRECFQDAQDRFPGAQSVTMRFTVEGRDLSGRIRGGRVVEGTVRDPLLEACFEDALEDAQFPAPEGTGAVTVQYPFRFDPRTDGGTKGGG